MLENWFLRRGGRSLKFDCIKRQPQTDRQTDRRTDIAGRPNRGRQRSSERLTDIQAKTGG